jgi:enterochelin esterase-like enzyme
MKKALICILTIVTALNLFAADENKFCQLGPDSLPQEGVPKGKIIGPMILPSQIFPGTQHTYWIYVPAQYDPKHAAALMIFNDGQAMMATNGDVRAQNVLDNLIWRREIPVMLAVFIDPGRTPEQPEPTPRNWGDNTTNRREEYNRLNDKYARVICDELMPVLTNQFNISPDPDMRAIAGASSGAIAAFTVAWERPNQFHKVISIIGSFVNLRGGDVYPEKVAASERKPIRAFFVDGVNDNRGIKNGNYDPARDWHYQNVRLVEALTKKGYDVNYTWGIGTHNLKQGGEILPEMMRWLWRDYPRSYDAHDMIERSFCEPAAPAKNQPPK